MSTVPNKTRHLPARKNPGGGARDTTSEKIAADLLAFQRAGGIIEKLGNTFTLKTISAEQAVSPVPVHALGKARSAVS